MATLTKVEMRTRILQHLGVLSADESANAADAAIVDEAIDAAAAKLRNLGLASFDTSAVPEYAQIGFRDYVAADVASIFGLDAQRRAEHEQRQALALQELRQQRELTWNSQPVEARYF